MTVRCGWVNEDPLYVNYHDHEWGIPVHDDQKLFEMITLEGAQAGLSWYTILKKRETYREAFDWFDVNKVALYDEAKYNELLENKGIVRNRLKIRATINNAKATIAIQEQFGSFDVYIWKFVNYEPIINEWQSLGEVPASTPLSDAISKDLKKRGFSFVGTTIIYAFMQAVGIVNDHVTSCSYYKQAKDR